MTTIRCYSSIVYSLYDMSLYIFEGRNLYFNCVFIYSTLQQSVKKMCCILFNLPKNKIERLQRIQNQAARMLKRIPRRNHITPVLKDLHWLRINERIEFKILILTHRAFYETGPRYLSELIKKHNSSNRTRRANDHCLLSIPPISKMCANSYFERSFSYAAPFLWNRLDMSIRMLDFDHFKSRIKTELYLRYFEA